MSTTEEKPKTSGLELDLILEYLSTFVLKIFKIKVEKWQKMLQGDERNVIFKFIDDEYSTLITMNLSYTGVLQVTEGFPSNSRNKLIYFIKQYSVVVTSENMRSVIISGTVSNDAINELTIFTEEIVYPLLCNPRNHVLWPEVIIEDVKKHVADFKNNLRQIQGELINQMFLPMPEGMENLKRAQEAFELSDGEIVDIYLKTNFEGIIIQWAHQINGVLKETSEVVKEKNKFPTPMDEIVYWKIRLKNMEGIYSQLRQLKVKQMAYYLEVTNSVYLQTFKAIMTNLVAGIVESRDIVVHQKPLIHYFESIQRMNFLESKHLIKPLVHCVALMWTTSHYYRRTERIVVFFQDLANLIIEQTVSTCNQKNLFFGEAFEQVIKIDQILDIVNYFLEVYENYKARLRGMFSEGTVPILWNFENERVFYRLYQFIKRLEMVRYILQTTVEMLKLEKVEFSGIRGKVLSDKTLLIFEKYNRLCNKISDIEYEPLNPEDECFNADYEMFGRKVKHFDYCLAKIFGEAFDDCFNLEHIFKFLQIIGELANRPRILKELQPRYKKIFSLFDEELSLVEGIFNEGVQIYEFSNKKPMIDDHYPPVAGFLWWIFKLRQRVSTIMLELSSNELLNYSQFDVKRIQQRFDRMMKNTEEKERMHYENWAATVSDTCEEYLKYSILTHEGSLLKLNFSHELKCLQREIKYLSFLDKYEIPIEGLNFYERSEHFEHVICKLNKAIFWYNTIQKDSHESEIALIQSQLDEIDVLLKTGLNELNWNSEVNEYVTMVYSKVDALQKRVISAQNNIKNSFENINKWSGLGMYDKCSNSKIGKSITLALNENQSRKIKRFNDITVSYNELVKIMEENYCLYFNIDKQESAEANKNYTNQNVWLPYVEYIDNKVKCTLISAVSISLKIMISYMDALPNNKSPFMEVLCELKDNEIKFSPELENSDSGIENIIVNMIEDIVHQSVVFKRIEKFMRKEDYSDDIENDQQIATMRIRILDVMKNTIDELKRYIKIYNKYSYLWLEDRDEFLYLFLKHGRVMNYESVEKFDLEDQNTGSPVCRPSLDVFKNQIDIFEALYKECDTLPETQLFHGWLLLNMKVLKQTLLNYISKWSNVFKQDIVNYVVKRLDDLDSFIENTINILSIELKDNNYEDLLCVMDCLINVREHQTKSTDEVFEPLKEHIELLKAYGVEFPEELYDEGGKKKHSVYTLLEVLPEKWKSLQKLAAVIRNNVAPLKINQGHMIVKQTLLFNTKTQTYYNDFRRKKLFFLDCEDAYELIDKTHRELFHFEEALVSLTKSCELFDVPPPDCKSITSARKELIMAKQIWDYYFLVEYTIEDWKKTPWKSIDAEGMDMECKRFTKDLKSLDKEVRNWELYVAIESIIKNLLTSLRAVTELQNPAIKDRHWIELMQTTKYDPDLPRERNDPHPDNLHRHDHHHHHHHSPAQPPCEPDDTISDHSSSERNHTHPESHRRSCNGGRTVVEKRIFDHNTMSSSLWQKTPNCSNETKDNAAVVYDKYASLTKLHQKSNEIPYIFFENVL